jgi:hypothetical protein
VVTIFCDASPCWSALNREINFPMAVLGPVLFLAFARFALICFFVAMLSSFLRLPGRPSVAGGGRSSARHRTIECLRTQARITFSQDSSGT